MKLNWKIFSLFCLTLITISCGNADDDVKFDFNDKGELGKGTTVDDCLGFGENDLILSIQEQYTAKPSKVSVFFKVSDADGNPVVGLVEDDFTIYEQGRNDDCFNKISTTESSKEISPNGQIFNNSTLLVLDLSKSVLDSSLDELKAASISFINNVMPEEEEKSDSFTMSIHWFDGEDKLHELNPLTSSRDELVAAIESITSTISSDASTDLYGAAIRSTDLASKYLKDNTAKDVIGAASVVLFTDGTDQASRYTKAAALKKVTDADPNISFFSIGLGSEIDAEILKELGKTFSVFATNKEELETTFNEISAKISERANSFYLFEYCTPKRDGSGTSNLVIQVKKQNREGAVQTKFSADGFTGGCGL